MKGMGSGNAPRMKRKGKSKVETKQEASDSGCSRYCTPEVEIDPQLR